MQARIVLELIRNQTQTAVIAAWASHEGAKVALSAAESEVRAANVALSGVQKEAQGGQRTTLDVLNSQQDLMAARARLIGAQRDRVIAAYALLSATGRLDVKTLGLNYPGLLARGPLPAGARCLGRPAHTVGPVIAARLQTLRDATEDRGKGAALVRSLIIAPAPAPRHCITTPRTRRENIRISTGSVTRMIIGASIMPPTTTIASGFCTCEPMPEDIAAGSRPTPAMTQVISTGRICSSPVRRIAAVRSTPASISWLNCDRMMMPSITEMPNSAMNPIAAETLNGMPHHEQRENAADHRHRDDAHGQQRVRHRAEIDPQQQRDQREAERHHDLEPRDRVLQVAELADPFQPRSRPATSPARRPCVCASWIALPRSRSRTLNLIGR